jgi:peroxiredoxin
MRAFRRSSRPLLIALALVTLGASPGERAPTLDAATLQGPRVSLAALRGRVVVVDFWASWCEPCRRAMPRLHALARARERQGITVLTVSVDDERANCERFMREANVTLPVVHDASHQIATAWSPSAMPSTFVIDREGVVRAVIAGERPGALEQAVNGLLRGEVAAR